MILPQKICIMTGTRAEYGLMRWLMHDLAQDPDFELQIVASAMHLAPEFGHTVDLIRADGFAIDGEVPCLIGGDDNISLGLSMAKALQGFTQAFSKLAPDLLVLLGDRFESFAAASAATALRIPIAHLHGGETTEGAMDEAFRHAITKMSHLHFVAAKDYARRVIQLGEQPERVFNVGAIGLDNFKRLDLPDAHQLSADLQFDLSNGFFLITQHSATLESGPPTEGINALIEALEHFPKIKLLFTKANADPGGRAINERLDEYAKAHKDRVYLTSSLGQQRYLGAMQSTMAVLGNSSSGLIEAPAIDVPTVNLGARQAGRLRSHSVIDCAENARAIQTAIEQAISPEFRDGLKASTPAYGRAGEVVARIIKQLRDVPFDTLLIKKFHDLQN